MRKIMLTDEEVVAMARQAGVRNLVFTHHDPSRTDVEVQDIVEQARQLAQAQGQAVQTQATGGGLGRCRKQAPQGCWQQPCQCVPQCVCACAQGCAWRCAPRGRALG